MSCSSWPGIFLHALLCFGLRAMASSLHDWLPAVRVADAAVPARRRRVPRAIRPHGRRRFHRHLGGGGAVCVLQRPAAMPSRVVCIPVLEWNARQRDDDVHSGDGMPAETRLGRNEEVCSRGGLARELDGVRLPSPRCPSEASDRPAPHQEAGRFTRISAMARRSSPRLSIATGVSPPGRRARPGPRTGPLTCSCPAFDGQLGLRGSTSDSVTGIREQARRGAVGRRPKLATRPRSWELRSPHQWARQKRRPVASPIARVRPR
jgi:hypothetical protein